MADNNLETVGGEQESSKIIINGVKELVSISVIQPGIIRNPSSNVKYHHLTNDTRIKHLVKKPLRFLKYILLVRSIISNEKPEIIHTQAQVSFFIVSLLKKLKLISSDIEIIHTERGLFTKYSFILKKVFLFFMKELDVLVTTTQFNMKYWETALFAKRINPDFKVIENTAGQIFELYDPSLKKSNDNLVLGFAGRYCDWKNWPLAMEISKNLNLLLDKKVSIKMAVGCLDPISEKDTIKMFSDMKKIFGDRFEGSININISQMNNFYYETDIFILTSNFNTESFGRTLVEAMSRKNVVLTTNAGGSVEVVGNKANVCNNSEQFVNRILEFYNNKGLMENEKDNNLQRVVDNYSLSNNIEKHIELYKKVLNS